MKTHQSHSMSNTPGPVSIPPVNCVGPVPGQNCPPDAQSDEKLAIYVYEYLVHAGFQSTAESFMKERFRDKTIRVGNAPGFLRSWWSVFWDLYCAAPELRDGDLQSSVEARAFYDYGMVTSGYPAGPVTPGPMAGGPGGVPPGPDNLPPHGHPPMMSGGPPFPMFPSGPGGPPMRGSGPGPGMMGTRFPRMPRMQHQEMPPGGHSGMLYSEGIPPNMRFGSGTGGPGGPGHPRMQLIGGPGGVPHHGMPPSSVSGVPQHHGGPGGPPGGGEPFRGWQPSSCLSPAAMGSMSNGPQPPTSATPIMPSPQSNAGLHPSSVGTPGGPGSVPPTCGPGGQGSSAPPPMSSVNDQAPSGVMSPEYLSGYPPGGGGGGPGGVGPPPGEDMDSMEIMRMKETLAEEAKSFETSEVLGGGTAVTSDYQFMS